jgi:hypothetical protein
VAANLFEKKTDFCWILQRRMKGEKQDRTARRV